MFRERKRGERRTLDETNKAPSSKDQKEDKQLGIYLAFSRTLFQNIIKMELINLLSDL